MNEQDNPQAKLAALRKEVAAAEAAEKLRASEAELADAKARLLNKAFICNQPLYDAVHLSLSLFKTVARRSHDGSLEVTRSSLSVVRYDKPKNSYEIYRNKTRYTERIDSVFSILLHQREIPATVFMQLWRTSADLGEAMMKWLAESTSATVTGVTPVTDIASTDLVQAGDDHDCDPPTDIPHIQLDSCDANMLPRKFFLPGYRYVVSTSSIIEGLAALRKEEQHLAGGSHLYEACCDMRYVDGKYEQINRLRTALTARLARH